MTQGETIISILLAVIAYLLYQIVRQLMFLTGRKMKTPFPKIKFSSSLPRKEKEKENLPN